MSGRRLTIDQNAPSAKPGEPAFVARPAGSPVYHGFVIVPETCTDGWCLGTITEFEDPIDDLVSAFQAVLPQLKAKYAELGHAV